MIVELNVDGQMANCEEPLANEPEICIAWSNLSYQVRTNLWSSTRKPILNHLSGAFQFHRLISLMGPSGAGKTTFANCLSGNAVGANFGEHSQLLLNSQFALSTLKLCYIEQNVTEFIEPRLMVRQILQHAFRFKNRSAGICGSAGRVSMEKHIASVLSQLMLPEAVLDRPFGKCSGGEQKRIAIGTELMCLQKQPDILLIDEPTTGLDSAAAFEVISCLQSLVRTHRMCIIASIHVPNSDTLQLFDRLYVLAKGGRCIYSGPPELIKTTLAEQIDFKVGAKQPPIEALITIANSDTADERVCRLANFASASEHSRLVKKQTELVAKPFSGIHHRKSFSLSDFALNLGRLLSLNFITNYSTQLLSVGIYIVNYLIIATLFTADKAKASGCFRLAANTNSSCVEDLQDEVLIRENINFVCYSFILNGIVTIFGSTFVFSNSVKTFRHEHRNEWYSFGVFYWSSTLVAVFELTLFAVFISSLSYFLSFQHVADDFTLNWNRFGHFFAFTWLLCFYMQGFGQAIGAVLANHTELAIVFSIVFHTMISNLNGFFVNTEANAFVDWLSSLVTFKFISRSVMYAFYGIDRCDWSTENAYVLKLFSVDRNRIGDYVLYVTCSILLTRFVTFLYLYGKYSKISFLSRPNKGSSKTLLGDLVAAADYNNTTEAIPIEKLVQLSSSSSLNKQSTNLQNKIIIAWDNLTLFESVSIIKQTSEVHRSRLILNDLRGCFHFGTLAALMGSSGAGKTSLLRTLNGQCKTRLSPSSRFYLSKHCPLFSCFISQNVSDHLIGGLTAKQMLIYASKLKNGNNSAVDHEAIVLGLLGELGIADTADTKVERCSGGEQKRLALAQELTAQARRPNFICIDEPTSGLDSNSSLILVQCLHNLTRLHPDITIAVSIHQPTTDILTLFDQLYVLARGGLCIYSGAPHQIEAHLVQSLNRTTKEEEEEFPIEEIVKLSSAPNADVHQLVATTNHLSRLNYDKLTSDIYLSPKGMPSNRTRFSFEHCRTLLTRHLVQSRIWPELLAYCILYFSYVYSLTQFYDLSMIHVDGCIALDEHLHNDTCALQTDDSIMLFQNSKYLFFFANMYLFIILCQASLEFYRNFNRFKNEHRNGWYSTGCYYLATSILEIVPLLPINLLYVYIGDYYEPLQPGFYWHTVLLLTLGAIATQSMAHISTILCDGQIRLQILLSTVVFIYLTVTANLFLLYDRMQYAYQMISNFAIPRFLFEDILLLVYGFGRCGHRQVQVLLEAMRLDDGYYFWGLAGIVGNTILYRCLALWLLVRAVKK